MFTVLHIADFALHAVLRIEPGLADRPAALFASTNKKSIALAANPPARACGIELGMTAPQAVARCPTLIIRAPLPAAEPEARAALLAAGFTLSPLIEDTAPGVCTADLKGFSLTGSEPGRENSVEVERLDPKPLNVRATEPKRIGVNSLHPSVHLSSEMKRAPTESSRLRQRVAAAVAQLAQLGLPATAGIARTPLLALYAARAATEAVFTITDEKAFLGPLPLSAADPSAELAAVLANWGLRTLGDLTALPRDEIVRRFGAEGLALWNRAAGGSSRPLHPVIPPQTFTATMEFEDEIETLEPLLFILRRFLDRLALELSASHHVATDLDLALRLADDTRHARSFRLPEPTGDVEILFRTLLTHLESLRTVASIRAMELRLTPARPLVRQQGLFDTGLRDPHGFAETLARVSALVGADRVGTPQLEDTHRPDAVKLVSPLAVVPPPANPPLHPPRGPLLRRFRPPLPARVEFTDNQPSYLWTERMHGEISFHSSAFSSSGEWWQSDRTWSRTEWDVALDGGGLYRLLFIGNAYFIEGEYD